MEMYDFRVKHLHTVRLTYCLQVSNNFKGTCLWAWNNRMTVSIIYFEDKRLWNRMGFSFCLKYIYVTCRREVNCKYQHELFYRFPEVYLTKQQDIYSVWCDHFLNTCIVKAAQTFNSHYLEMLWWFFFLTYWPFCVEPFQFYSLSIFTLYNTVSSYIIKS